MKECITTTRTIGYLQKIFRLINHEYFNDEINEPMITITQTPEAYGHVTVGKVWSDGEVERRELNISAETMNRPIENVVATMIHEASHLWNMEKGIKDTSNNGIYHNKKFKETAEGLGHLRITKHERYGWTITEPTERTITDIINWGLSDIKCHRVSTRGWANGGEVGKRRTTGTGDDKPKSNVGSGTSSTRKYICPNCNTTVRATKTVDIICGKCMVAFELA